MTQLVQTQKGAHKSLIFAFLDTIPYAIIPLIWLIPFDLPSGFLGSIAKAVVVTVSKDLLSALFYLSIIILKGQLSATWMLVKTKVGFYLIVGGIFGGPIGYVLFNAAFFIAGASYAHIFTSLQPILIALISIFWLKRKYNWKLWIGILITVFAIIALVFGQSLEAKSISKILIGALLGFLGALSWALETLFFDKTYNLVAQNKQRLAQLLAVKTFFSVLFGITIMFPFSALLATNSPATTYLVFADIFTKGAYLWRFFGAGILIILGRSLLFYAIERSGGTLVTVIYNLTVIITPFLAYIWFLISGVIIDPSIVGTRGLVILMIAPFIVFGVVITTIYKPRITRPQNNEKKTHQN